MSGRALPVAASRAPGAQYPAVLRTAATRAAVTALTCFLLIPTSGAGQGIRAGTIPNLDTLAVVVKVQAGVAPLGVTNQSIRREVHQILARLGIAVAAGASQSLHIDFSHGVTDCRLPSGEPGGAARPVRFDLRAWIAPAKGDAEAVWSDSIRRQSDVGSLRGDVIDALRQLLSSLPRARSS